MMAYHPVVQQILDLIRQRGSWHETFEHGEVLTSEQAAQTRPGYTLGQGVKAMIVKAYTSKSDGRFVMLTFPADRKFDSKKVQTALGVKNLRFATMEEVTEATGGVQPGGVPPFGNLFGLDMYADPAIFENEKIVFNAGDRKFSVAIKSADWKNLVNPKPANII